MTQLTRYEPFRVMRREFDRLFEDFLPALTDDAPSPTWSPRFDLMEREDMFLVRMDLPGLAPEDITVEMADNRLIVRGERRHDEKTENENYVRMERAYGSFYRSFVLPRNVHHDAIEGSFDAGVLTLTLPKTEEARPRRIDVKAGHETELSLN